MDEVPGKKRTHEKSKPESDADERERLGPILGFGVVRDVRLRERDVPSGRAVDDAREVHHPQGRGAREQEESEERADLAREEQRFSPETVRGLAEERRRHELTERINGDEQRRFQRRRPEMLQIDREQRE